MASSNSLSQSSYGVLEPLQTTRLSSLRPYLAGIAHIGGLNSTRAVTTSAAAELADVEATASYDASQIQVLQGLDPVRKRPGMYIGSTGQRGLHHLVYEILDNAIDEVQGGHAKNVWVELDVSTGWVMVRDDGRGIPTDMHPVTGKSALETVLTVLHAGGKFGGDSSGYSVSGGLHGVGVSVVNALSEKLEVSVWREGKKYQQSFSRGVPQTDLEVEELAAGSEDENRGGTRVRFKYDDTIFSKSATFDPETIRSRLRELAFLNSSATIHFRVLGGSKSSISAAAKEAAALAAAENGTELEENTATGAKKNGAKGKKVSESSNGASSSTSTGNGATATPGVVGLSTGPDADGWEILHFSGGLAEYVAYLNRDKQHIHAPIFFSKENSGVQVEIALQWCQTTVEHFQYR